jgi:5-(carboxyamino)imidazole ribonucleotide mutase
MSAVLVILGSKSDLEVGQKAVSTLKRLRIEAKIVIASAHRSPERVKKIVEQSDADVFIAIAGLSAALPGAVASFTIKPVIGVPVSGKVNLDSILAIVQMPPGIPVAAVGIDRGDNAALLAAQIIALSEMAEQVEKDSQEIGS